MKMCYYIFLKLDPSNICGCLHCGYSREFRPQSFGIVPSCRLRVDVWVSCLGKRNRGFAANSSQFISFLL